MSSSHAATTTHPSFDLNKLSYEIFSILESKFLFAHHNPSSPHPPKPSPDGRVRILSIDACSSLPAAASLSRLESSLAAQSGNPAARISDFFDLAAGSGSGGLLVAMLFTRSPSGRPLFSALDALRFFLKHQPSATGRKPIFRRSSSGGMLFGRMFGASTLCDTIKPVLIPCYDAKTGSTLVFSRADAVEAEAFDFWIRDVCAATCAERERERAKARVRSVGGRRRIDAVGGGVVMRNPTAMAITHVLNNRVEFPFAAGVEDLLVLSLGERGTPAPAPAEILKIAGEGAAEMVWVTLKTCS